MSTLSKKLKEKVTKSNVSNAFLTVRKSPPSSPTHSLAFHESVAQIQFWLPNLCYVFESLSDFRVLVGVVHQNDLTQEGGRRALQDTHLAKRCESRKKTTVNLFPFLCLTTVRSKVDLGSSLNVMMTEASGKGPPVDQSTLLHPVGLKCKTTSQASPCGWSAPRTFRKVCCCR